MLLNTPPPVVCAETEILRGMEEDSAEPTSIEQKNAICSVNECSDVALTWCEQCQLSFCDYLHGPHSSHSAQTMKVGCTSKSDWEEVCHALQCSPVTTQKKRKNTSSKQPVITAPPSLRHDSPLQPFLEIHQSSTVQHHVSTANIFRMKWDDKEKREKLVKEKLLLATNFIKSLH